MENLSNLEERLDVIAARVSLREPFIAAVATRLKRECCDWVGTAATDGATVWYDGSWCAGLSNAQLLFVMLHEIMHVILLHNWRRRGRDHARFNVACDLVINTTLLAMGYPDMPEEGKPLLEAYPWVTLEMDAEEVYARLPKDAGNGKGNSDWAQDVHDAADPSAELSMEASIQTAAKMAKACGKHSALLNRVLTGTGTPVANWLLLLRHVLTSTGKGDYTFNKVNKRFVASNIYLPAPWSPKLGGLIVAIDTSASMGQEELNQIATEITAISEDCQPDWVRAVYCDTTIAGTERFETGEEVILHAKGGGGTRFKPVFDWVAESIDEPIAALIYFTDLQGDTRELDPVDYPVIWGLTYKPHKEVPFGEIAQLY